VLGGYRIRPAQIIAIMQRIDKIPVVGWIITQSEPRTDFGVIQAFLQGEVIG